MRSLVTFDSQFSSSRRCAMLPCRRRATRASSAPTSDRLVAACIVSFVLVSSCSLCAAQEVIDIAPEDVSRYYPRVSYLGNWEGKNKRDLYTILVKDKPVTVLLRTDPESEFKMEIRSRMARADQRLESRLPTPLREQGKGNSGRTWTMYEKAGSEQFHRLTQVDVMYPEFFLTKQADGTKIRQWDKNIQPVPVEDCALGTKSLGDRLIYMLTFASDSREGHNIVLNSTTTVFVRFDEEPSAPTSSSSETTTTGTAATMKSTQKLTSKPAVDTQALSSHRTPPNANDTRTSESSAAGGLQLGPLVTAVVFMQLLVAVFLRV